MKPLLLLSFILFSMGVNSQNWLWASSTTGSIYSDEGLCVATDPSGNSFLGGVFASPTMSFGSYTVNQTPFCGTSFLTKFDPNGNPLWARSFGCGDVWAIATDQAGNVYFTGDYLGYANFGTCSLNNNGNGDFFIAKYDPNGNCIWSQTATGTTGDRGYDVEVSASGDVYVCGLYTSASLTFGSTTITNSAAGWDETFVAKYNSAGVLQWARSGGGGNYDDCYNLATDGNNNVYITGWFEGTSSAFGSFTLSSFGGRDIFLVKYDANGTVIAANSFGGTGNENAYAVSCDGGNNVIITGSFSSATVNFGTQSVMNLSSTGNFDAYVAKFDANGNALWAKSINGSQQEYGYAVDTDGNNAIVVGGGSGSSQVNYGATNIVFPNGFYDPSFVLKLDQNGILLCSSGLASGGDDQNGVAFDPSGNILFGGDFMNVDPFIFGNDSLQLDSLEDVFVAKFNATCSVEGVNENEVVRQIKIYPIPADEYLEIEISSSALRSTIEILDVTGRIVTTIRMNHTIEQIDTHELQPGIYFGRIESSSAFPSFKFVKQ